VAILAHLLVILIALGRGRGAAGTSRYFHGLLVIDPTLLLDRVHSILHGYFSMWDYAATPLRYTIGR
jgi:hypothetical protein